jgi:inositol-phosphate transport system permease protein
LGPGLRGGDNPLSLAMPDFARAQLNRQRANAALFLGPAVVLLACFFVAPVVVDLGLAFTDMDRTLAVTRFTLENFERMATRDSRLLASLGITTIFVLSTLSIFNVSFALLLALTTTAVPKAFGAFFQAVWLLPRMSPSVVYALLWAWVVDPNERGLLNQILVHVLGLPPIDLRGNLPLLTIILANGFIGASLGMIIFTSAIRSIPEHLFHAARADGAGALAIVRYVVFPAMRWPISYMTIHQTLSLLVSFEYILLITGGGPFYDTTVFSLYAYRRAFENGQYAYGAALSLILIVIGVIAALGMWRLMDMRRLLQSPRIEVH